jgi:crossover junction endodeoxyribonuclease RusA
MTKTGHVYNPDTAKEWKETVMAAFLMHRKPQITEPVSLTVSFFLPRPKSMKDPGRFVPHTNKPDADNLLKALQDAVTDAGIWTDDALVFASSVDKWYAREAIGAKVIVEALLC